MLGRRESRSAISNPLKKWSITIPSTHCDSSSPTMARRSIDKLSFSSLDSLLVDRLHVEILVMVSLMVGSAAIHDTWLSCRWCDSGTKDWSFSVLVERGPARLSGGTFMLTRRGIQHKNSKYLPVIILMRCSLERNKNYVLIFKQALTWNYVLLCVWRWNIV